MKIGIIDMGTNTFHLIIAKVNSCSFELLYKEKRSARLGEGGINQGYITQAAAARATSAIKAFKGILNQYQVDTVRATATSAVRNAKNGEELTRLIKRESGIEVNILSGLDEAGLIYDGVTQALEIGNEPALIMDIGGGSIEFIIGTSEKALWKQSFEIGGQRIMDLFHKHDPISPHEIQNIEDYIDLKLKDLFEAVNQLNPQTLIGSSGTFDTFSDMYNRHEGILRHETTTECSIPLRGFTRLHDLLISKDRKARLAIPGMIEMRVDMIVVSSVVINHLMKKLNLRNIRVSAYALKEGVLLHHINGRTTR